MLFSKGGDREKVLGNVWFRIERTDSDQVFQWMDGKGGWEWKFIEIVSRDRGIKYPEKILDRGLNDS